MRISYNKLWKMLIDKEMNRNDLKELPELVQLPLPNSVKVPTSQQMFFSKSAKLWIVG